MHKIFLTKFVDILLKIFDHYVDYSNELVSSVVA